METIDIILSFIISYTSGTLPTLKGALSRDFEQSFDNCYQKALKKWCKNDYTRNSLSTHKFKYLTDLRTYLQDKNGSIEKNMPGLVELWAEELRNDSKCYNFIIEQKIDGAEYRLSASISELNELEKDTNDKITGLGMSRVILPDPVHGPVKDYIPRYCKLEKETSDIKIHLGLEEHYTLADFLLGLTDETNNKYILYSSAQVGKTTELKNLGWTLSKSGLYNPYFYEVKNNRNLSINHLPVDSEVNGKKVVILIDALDEVNGDIHKNLLSEIGKYSTLHEEIPMVVSCRKNYRRDKILEHFTPLFLQDITQDELFKFVKEKAGNATHFLQQARDLGITDMITKPFFLKVLIEIYKKGGKLPSDSIDVYQKFISDSFSREHSKPDSFLLLSEQETCARLCRMAIVMMLTGKQELYVDEVRLCLQDMNCIKECCRVDLLQQSSDENYLFINNAIKEFFAAKYLSDKGLNDVIRFVCFPMQNKTIKPDWYHIVLLWLAFVKKERTDQLQPVLDWLKDSCMELMINVDYQLVDEATRNEVFKSILLEYKQLGIRFSNILAEDYRNLMMFAQTDESIRFIASELKNSHNNTAYQSDLFCLCMHVNWAMLGLRTDVFSMLFDAYIDTLKSGLQANQINSLSLLVFENNHFHTNEYAALFYNLLKDYNHYDCIKALIGLFSETDVVDQYIDYILQKEVYVHNIQNGSNTTIVSRNIIYIALSKVKTADGINKVLAHDFNNSAHYYSDEIEDYLNMEKIILQQAIMLYNKGCTAVETTIRKAYLDIFGVHHFLFENDNHKQSMLLEYRNFYEQTGCSNTLRRDFYENIIPLFDDLTTHHRDDFTKGFALTALWLTKEEMIKIFANLDNNSDKDEFIASWFISCPWNEISEHARTLNNSLFPETNKLGEEYWRKQQKDFDEMSQHSVFKELVIDVLDKKKPSSLKELHSLDEDNDECANHFIYYFLGKYVDDDNQYRLDEVRTAIDDEVTYQLFFMEQVAEKLVHGNSGIDISDELKVRTLEIAEELLIAVSQEEYNPWYSYIQAAIKLLLVNYFKVEEKILLGLLDYGHIYVFERNEGNFGSNFTLFDYMREKVDTLHLKNAVVTRMKQTVEKTNYHEFTSHASFVIDNHIDEGINLVFRHIVISKARNGIDLLDKLIRADCRLDAIFDLLDILKDEEERIFIMERLCNKERYKSRIKERLLPKWQQLDTFKKRRVLCILLKIGCLEALQYVTDNPNEINDTPELVFSYDNIDAVPLLCKVLKFLWEKENQVPFTITHVVTSLENIAIENEKSLQIVIDSLESLIASDKSLRKLNHNIQNIKAKFNSKHSHEMTIIEALAYIDGKKEQELVDAEIKYEQETKEENIKVFISYNWEEPSNAIVENIICSALEKSNINYVIDKNDCKFHMSIREFEEQIGRGDKIIVVVCKKYFESENCMYEAACIIANGNLKDRMYIIHMGDVKRDPIEFYKPMLMSWKQKMDKMGEEVKEIGCPGNEPFVLKYEKYKKIYDNIGFFWNHFDDNNSKSLIEMTRDECKDLFKIMKL